VVELSYRWAPNGRVEWSDIALEEVSTPAPRRVRQRGPTASTSGTVTIDLEVSGDEDAVILHDNDGVLPCQIVYACSHRLVRCRCQS